MRRFVMVGFVSLVAAGGCIVGNYGTELSVTSSAGASSSSSGCSSSSSSTSSSTGGMACPVPGQTKVDICNNGVDEWLDDDICILAPAWTKRFGDAENQSVLGLQIHPKGGIFLAGSFGGQIDVQGMGTIVTSGLPPGAESGYIAALSDDGSGLWISKQDATAAGSINGLALRNTDVFAAGSTRTGAPATESALVQKFAQSAGEPGKYKAWSSSVSPLLNAVDVAYSQGSANGDFIAIVGVYQGKGNDPCDAMNALDLDAKTPISVVLKLDPKELNCLGKLILPAPTPQDNNQPTSIAMNTAAEVFVAGTYTGSIGNLCGVKPSGTDTAASYVLKTKPDLTVSWHKEFVASSSSGSSSIKILDVAVSPITDQIFVTGFLIGSVDPGNGTTYTSVNADLFVMEMNSSNGDVQWFSLVKGDGVAAGQSIVEFNNEIYVAGLTDGEMGVEVNPPAQGESAGSICSSTARCPFLMKFDRTCGNAIWAVQLGAEKLEMIGPKTARLAASDAGLLLGLTWDDNFILGNGPLISSGSGGTDIILAKFFTPKP